MIERVIENWLDSTTEREYETAFCQALAAERHRIIHRSTHGPTEQGKDLICLGPDGTYHAYQLKTGDVNLEYWRRIRPEVEELVQVPIQHPNVPKGTRHKPFLVTNGVINDPVRLQINALNEKWQERGDLPLEIIDKGYLHQLFINLQSSVLPSEPVDFERFLRLFLSDKQECLDKDQFSAFIESLTPAEQELGRSQLRRIFAATAVISGFVLSGYQRARSWFALAEGWLVVLSYLLRLAEGVKLYEPIWMPSVSLCVEAWEQAVEELVKEALLKEHWLEGDFLTDVEVVGYRSTILLGYMSAFSLYLRAKESKPDLQAQIFTEVSRKLKPKRDELMPFHYWGESASPFLFATALFMQSRGQERIACEISSTVVALLSRANALRRGPGLPDPHYGPESVLRMRVLGEHVLSLNQSFAGQAFTLRPFVEFLARREWKGLLRSLWYRISFVNYAEFVPDERIDMYRWHVRKGRMQIRFWRQPEQWERLYAESTKTDEVNLLLEERFAALILPYLLVYPHRMNSRLCRLAERALLK